MGLNLYGKWSIRMAARHYGWLLGVAGVLIIAVAGVAIGAITVLARVFV